MMINRSKVRGCFLGVAIGDALGKPVEMNTAEYIQKTYGRVEQYLSSSNHKYFAGDMAGTWTDDTQLTLAIARAFIRDGEFNLDSIAEEHATEFMNTVAGWGRTTKDAVAKLVDGGHWSRSGYEATWPEAQKPVGDMSEGDIIDELAAKGIRPRGAGNGVAMKMVPIAVYMAATNPQCDQPAWTDNVNNIAKVAAMTHYTSMGVTSGLAQAFAIFKCLQSDPDGFDVKSFINAVCSAGMMGRQFLASTITEDDLANRFQELHKFDEYYPERIVEEFKGGCYIYESLPFTYMFFARNHNDVESLYDCVSAGGDADSNGSMLASLLGALHGEGIFPSHLIDGLDQKDLILETADKLCDKLKIG
jgi:ADP-ribosylglycohydrolase